MLLVEVNEIVKWFLRRYGSFLRWLFIPLGPRSHSRCQRKESNPSLFVFDAYGVLFVIPNCLGKIFKHWFLKNEKMSKTY